MIIVDWFDDTVKVKKNGTDWSDPQGFVQDKTRSGKVKRRPALSMEKRRFNVALKMSKLKYLLFRNWYKNVTLGGLYYFSCFDIEGGQTKKIYRIADGGAPKYSNTSGKIVDVKMVWEEVGEQQN